MYVLLTWVLMTGTERPIVLADGIYNSKTECEQALISKAKKEKVFTLGRRPGTSSKAAIEGYFESNGDKFGLQCSKVGV
ncbi:hypothetical protein PQ077_01275 [Litorivicinus sp.]|nr:hypothetical protein [Litorivicinus sp.]